MSIPVAASSWDRRVGTIAGIPVILSPWILLMVLYIASQASSLVLAAVGAVALLLSVFVHELGHAWEAKRQQLKPAITLHGVGGFCSHQQPRSADGEFRVIAAGPAAGALLAAVAFLASRLVHTDTVLDELMRQLWVLGGLWTVVNLMPVQPLDGGALALNLARRFPSFRRADYWMAVVGVQVALLLAVMSSVMGLRLFAVLALVFAYENAARLRWVRSVEQVIRSVQQRGRHDPLVGGLLVGLVFLLVRNLAAMATPAGSTLALAWPDLHLWQSVSQQIALDEPSSFDVLVSLMAGQVYWRVQQQLGLPILGVLWLLCSLLTLPVAAVLATSGATGSGTAATGTAIAALVLLLSQSEGTKGLKTPLPAVLLLVALLVFRLVNPSPQRVFIDVVAASAGLLVPVVLLQWRSLVTWWKLRDPPPVDLG